MPRVYPQGPALTSDEEKILWENDVVSKLTEGQWRAFGAWVGANDPDVLDAKHWITKENNLDLNTFSLACLRVLIKQAKFKWHGLPEQIVADWTVQDLVVRRPGFGLPLGHMPERKDRFPLLFMDNKFGDGWRAATLLIRECCMLKLVDELSDKPEWWLKVNDEAIANKWKEEALAMNWTSYLKHADFTTAMADACINELRVKAQLYQKTGLMPVYDYSVAIIKSDNIMTPELAASLQEAIKLLEDVPLQDKDWHPGSDEQVLDLVHPSLWPLIYGRSRVLTDRVIGVGDALDYCGMGSVLPAPADEETICVKKPGSFCEEAITVLSNRFQWLPCDVALDPMTGGANVTSYINNLHPQKHARLYPLIERFIEKSLPAWDAIYRWEKCFAVQRLKTDTVDMSAENLTSKTREEDASGSEDSEDDDEDWEADYDNLGRKRLDDSRFASTHKIKLPDADPTAEGYVKIDAPNVKTKGFFNDKTQIQVIVKLANIHLTPEKPSYGGGAWHTEGQLNEHIIATALYYYDSDNITECTLDFRTCANAEDLAAHLNYEQNKHRDIGRIFAIRTGGNILQNIGSVRTSAGRALFFPNILQHHVSPFKLVDPTKPGHRKILALFLVDPAIPITSTSNVPPQQKHWYARPMEQQASADKLPFEAAETVENSAGWPIGLEEAKELRLRLMSDRTWLQDEEEGGLERERWNFCEH